MTRTKLAIMLGLSLAIARSPPRRAAVPPGQRVTARACGGEHCPAALLHRLMLRVSAAAAEQEGHGDDGHERPQRLSAGCRCGRASSGPAAARRRGRAGPAPTGIFASSCPVRVEIA